MYLCEIYSKNIFAFVQIGRLQNLLALQRTVGLHIDLLQLIIGIFEKQFLRSLQDADVDSDAHDGGECEFRNEHEDAAFAMLRYGARAHFYIEQMLLPSLTRI